MILNQHGQPDYLHRNQEWNQKVEKDDWRTVSGPEKRLRLDKQRRGRTVFKIKEGMKLPEDVSNVKSSNSIRSQESLIRVTR